MSRTTKFACCFLFALGVLIGPGYVAYAWFFSGEKVRTIKIQNKNSSKHSTSIELSPEMNPIVLRLKGSFIPSRADSHSDGKVNRYYVKLKKNGDDIYRTIYLGWIPKDHRRKQSGSWIGKIESFITWEEHGSSNAKWLYSRSDPIRLSNEKQYRLVFREDPKRHEIRMNHLELKIKRDVLIPDTKIFLSGIGLIVLSLILSVTAMEQSIVTRENN